MYISYIESGMARFERFSRCLCLLCAREWLVNPVKVRFETKRYLVLSVKTAILIAAIAILRNLETQITYDRFFVACLLVWGGACRNALASIPA